MNKTHGGNIWQVSKETGLSYQDIIDFSSSINPLGMSPKAITALKDFHKIIPFYPEPSADEAIDELLRFHNIPFKNIIAGNGSTEFIYLIPQVFKPKKALIIEPCFSEYRNSLEIYGCKIETIRGSWRVPSGRGHGSWEKSFLPDTEELCIRLKNNYDILYIGNPANPTGVLLKKDEVLKIACECRKYGTVLVVDEAFIDFIEDESVKNNAVKMDNLIVLRSMTKFFAMAGLRFGYLISSKKIAENIKIFQPLWSVNTLSQIAAIESLKDKDYIENTKRWFESEHRFLFEGLEINGLKPYPSKANYFLVEIKIEGLTSKMICNAMSKYNVLIRDCSSFGLGDKFFRVAVKNRRENILLIEKLGICLKSMTLI